MRYYKNDLLRGKKRSCEEMNPRFFTAPFYFAFIWFKVQGSGFRALVAASPPFFRRWYFRIAAFPSRECIQLSGRTFLAPHRGSCPKG